IADASLSGSKVTSAITSLANLKGGTKGESVKIKDVIMDAEIKDGRLHVKPFEVNLGGYKTTVSGSNGIMGDLDYRLKMDIPSGAAGEALNSALASFTGGKSVVGENIKLNIGLGGTYDDPKVKLLGSESSEGGSAAKAAAKAALDEQKAKAEAELAKKKAEAEAKAKEELARKKKEAEEKAKAEAEKLKKQAEEKAKDALKGLFKKK
ncbi:MAG: AsmA-like C-terminal region-containing protein, partial [Cytophagales bacterium]|nr:AsmA-like C-terminal region-containing protein [Cytophagales bacterium]